jgi:hypothetical protein
MIFSLIIINGKISVGKESVQQELGILTIRPSIGAATNKQ